MHLVAQIPSEVLGNSLEVEIKPGEICISLNSCESTCTDLTPQECAAIECRNDSQKCEAEATLEGTQAYYMCLQDCSGYPKGSIQYEKCEAKCAKEREATYDEEYIECILKECGEDAFATSTMVPVGFIALVDLESGFGSLNCQGTSSYQINEQAGLNQMGQFFVELSVIGNLQPLPLDECYLSSQIESQYFNDNCIGCITLNYVIFWADVSDLIAPSDFSVICQENGPANILICNG